jgi:uncharacterized membrane protein
MNTRLSVSARIYVFSYPYYTRIALLKWFNNTYMFMSPTITTTLPITLRLYVTK